MPPRRWFLDLLVLLGSIGLVLPSMFVPPRASAQEARVRAVMFYDPDCANCEAVQAEVLPALDERYGPRFELVQVDASTLPGFDLWSQATRLRDVPEDERGVPLLIIGAAVLSGQDQIREGLGDAIERGLSSGGLELPADMGLSEADVAFWAEHRATQTREVDPLASGLAILVLVGMLAVLTAITPRLGRALHLLRGARTKPAAGWSQRAVPILGLAGLAVAGYLSWIKWNSSTALCPIGNCEAVQHSPYAQLFGVPVAYLGLATYVLLLALWLVEARSGPERASAMAAALFLLAAFGTLFSAYLTFLEPFVIGAVCVWCLASALLMTGILWASSRQIGLASRHGGRHTGHRHARA